MAASMAAAPLGDLPWLESARGGSREWTWEGFESTAASMVQRTSQPVSDREDDFVALKKAALAQKQSKSMLVLPAEDGRGLQVLDARKLGREDQRQLMDRVLGAADKDNCPLLVKMHQRMARVGIENPTIRVRYCDLSVLVRLTVGDRSVPSLSGTVSRRVEPLMRTVGKGSRKTDFAVIDRACGVIRPGIFTLLLGPPGSGKSTLLRTLAGQHTKGSHLRVVAEELTYNGLRFDEFKVARSAAYVSQVDNHYGELTVRETLEFSARCQSSGYHKTLLEELLRREEEQGVVPDPEVDAYMRAKAFGSAKSNLIVELIIRLLGLDVCADTVVGNQMLRGISGGQKKRVTTGEMALGPVKAMFCDEISTGLDSNTTYQICKAFRNFTHVMQATMVVGLLQPQPETYDLFDEVIMLSSGKICYHGPREGVLPFFDVLGFCCPERRGVADFLQEVTTPSDQRKYWKEDNPKPYRFVTARMFEDAFHETEAWRSMEAEMATPFQPGPASHGALAHRKYGQRFMELVRANFRRVWTLTQRSKVFAIFRLSQVALMAFVVATVFWREDKNTVEDGNLFLGVAFYSQLFMLLGGLAEMHLLIDRLPVFFKQRDMRFYPGWAFALPAWLLRVPFGFLESTIWTYIVYFIVGFSPSVRVLMFWLLMFLQNIWSTSLFQTIAAVCRNDAVATAFGSLFMLIFFNTGGFVLNKNDIPPWWIGAYWANPYGYITRGLAINEFTSTQWDKPNPANPSSILGLDVLAFRGFSNQYWWVWVAVGFNIGSLAINVLAFITAATFLPAPRPPGVISPELLHEFQISRAPRPPSFADPHTRPDVEASAVARPSGVRVVDAYPAGPAVEDVQDVEAAGGRPESNFATTPRTPSRPVPLPGTSDGSWAGREVAGLGPGAGGAKSGAQQAAVVELVSRAGSEPFFGEEDEWLRRGSYILRASQRESFAAQQAQGYRQRTAIPYEPLSLTFKTITYSVPLPPDADSSKADVGGEGPHAGQLRLLKSITGVFRPGVLTALMGASGAGKTTLMDVLAGRKTGGVITGDVRMNGFPKDQKTFARVMGYVEQTDIHLPQTTVEEACHFSTRLRLPTTVDASTRNAFVEEVMSIVELARLRHAYVGVPGVSGLSVEQRKRLTMAVELVANPSIVFMDEPTSGLDARAAGIVMGAVRNTVDTGRTVTCTIHQPSLDIFEAFDELLLLKPGGRTIYFGPIGDDSQRLIGYFQAIPGVPHIKPRENPATYMLEVSNPGSEAALGVDFSDIYARSDLAREMERVVEQHHEPAPGAKPLEYGAMHVASAPTQFLVNLGRFFKMYWRSPEYNVTRFGVTILVAFVFGSLFWRLGDNRTSVSGVLNIMGVLYSSTLFVGISNCLSVQHVVAVQRAVMYRERAAGTYGVLPFSLAQQLVEVPYILVQSIIYVSAVYWSIWFARDAAKFFWWLLYFFLTLCYFTFFGVMNTCLTPTVAFSNVLSSFFFGFWNLLSGFLIPQPRIPGWWIWFFWCNPVMWTLYGMIVSQLGDYTNEYITDLNGNAMSIPEFLEQQLFFKYSMRGPIVAILFGYILAFCLISALALKKFNFQNR